MVSRVHHVALVPEFEVQVPTRLPKSHRVPYHDLRTFSQSGPSQESNRDCPSIATIQDDMRTEGFRFANGGHRTLTDRQYRCFRQARQGEIHSTMHLAVETGRLEVVLHSGMSLQW